MQTYPPPADPHASAFSVQGVAVRPMEAKICHLNAPQFPRSSRNLVWISFLITWASRTEESNVFGHFTSNFPKK